jgi:hypothetical protein
MAALVAALALLVAAPARAEGIVDPSYGRVDGDLTVAFGLGGTIGSGGFRPEAEVRARYLETAGIFASYEDGPVVGLSPDPSRVVKAGVELRPLFLYRWLRGYETRRERLDLLVDSAGLELGFAWAQPKDGSFDAHPGLVVGFGLELPITLDPSGLWLAVHAGLRWSEGALATGNVDTSDEREAYVTVTLAWHAQVVSHMVDVGDRAPE